MVVGWFADPEKGVASTLFLKLRLVWEPRFTQGCDGDVDVVPRKLSANDGCSSF